MGYEDYVAAIAFIGAACSILDGSRDDDVDSSSSQLNDIRNHLNAQRLLVIGQIKKGAYDVDDLSR